MVLAMVLILEEYSDGKRRQLRFFCDKCGKFLGDSAYGSLNPGTREEIGNLLCKECQKKIDTGLINTTETKK
jgi:hypothetical protein